MDDITRKVRHDIFTFYLRECRPPTLDELATESGFASTEVSPILNRLEDLHHIVLYKYEACSPSPIAMAYPFSHLPKDHESWWANCAWCAFGLAAMLSPARTTVSVRSGSIGTEMQFVIENDEIKCQSPHGEIQPSGCCVHFSVPPSKWWMDVRYACGTIQFFATRQDVLEWPRKHSFYAGEILSLETLRRLSKAWYHRKHTYGYSWKTSGEVDELFRELGMVSDFWKT